MKKKIIAAIIGVMAAVSLVGCKGSDELSNDYVTINKYKGLEIEKIEEKEITDEAIEAAIIEDVTATTVTDRAAEMGDTVNLDYVGTVDGVEFEGGNTNGAGTTLELGSGSYIGATEQYQGFEEQIVGHTPGETFDITVQFPAEYKSNPDMNNAVAVFKITLNSIYNKEEDFSDAWVQANSTESKTMDEYREEVRAELEETYEKEYQTAKDTAVMEAFTEEIEVKKLPEDKVEEEYSMMVSQYEQIASMYGMEMSDFIAGMGTTEEEFEKKMTEFAEDSAKRKIAYELLAEELDLAPTEDEYKERIAQWAEEYGFDTPEAFEEQYGEETIREVILEENVLAYLSEHAVQVEPKEEDTKETEDTDTAEDTADEEAAKTEE